jgi:hypothetical protein
LVTLMYRTKSAMPLARVGRIALVGDRDGEALVEERHLLHPPGQHLVRPFGRLKDRVIRPEQSRGAGFIRRVAARHRPGRVAPLVGLVPDVAVLVHLHLGADREGVHDRDADPMQATGYRIGLAVELAARMQRGHDDLKRGPVLHRVLVNGDAAAVVYDPDTAVGQQCHLDVGGVASHRLVDRVVHNFLDQVVQTALAGRADVHAGPFADSLQPFKNRDRACVVGQSELHPASEGARLGPPYFTPCPRVSILAADSDCDDRVGFLSRTCRQGPCCPEPATRRAVVAAAARGPSPGAPIRPQPPRSAS